MQSNVDALLTKIRRKYKEYGINEKPFVVVKADNGSYGAGIMTVRDAKELADAGRRTRERMGVPEGSPPITEVIIQEGVPTYERVNDAVAEPVVYMIDRYVVGGFYRVHAERGIDENLNAPGASFVPLAFAESHHLPRPGEKPGASAPNRFYMYGVIGRLGHAGRQLRAGSHRPGRRGSTTEAAPPSPQRRAICQAGCGGRAMWLDAAHNGPAHNSPIQIQAAVTPRPHAVSTAHAPKTPAAPGCADPGRAGGRLRRHRHQPAVRAGRRSSTPAMCRPRPRTSWACCR